MIVCTKEKAVKWIILLLMLVACSGQKIKEYTPSEKRADLYYNHGSNALYSKDYTKALDNLLKAAKLDPKNSKIFNNLGMSYHFKKRDDLAIVNLKKAIELDETNSDARNNLGSIYFLQNKLELAEKEFQEIEKDLVYPSQYLVKYNLALISKKRGHPYKAIDRLKDSILENPNYCSSPYQLGIIYMELNSTDKAIESFRQATMGQCSTSPLPHIKLVDALIAAKKYIWAEKKIYDIIQQFKSGKYVSEAKEKLEQLQNQNLINKNSIISTRNKFNKHKNNMFVSPSF